MAIPPDRPDFTALATPSDHKALKRLADMDTVTSTPSDDDTQKRGPSGAVLGALVAPGSPSFFRKGVLSAVLLLLGFVIPVATVVVALVRRNQITSLVLDENFLLALQVIAVLFVVTRLISVIEVIRSRSEGSPRRLASTLGVVGVILLTLPAVWSIWKRERRP